MKASSVRPITELKNRTKQLVQEVSETGQSVVITQNGKPKVVVMGVEEHDRLNDTLLMLKLLAHGLEVQRRSGKRYSTAEVRKRAQGARVSPRLSSPGPGATAGGGTPGLRAGR